MKEKERTEDIMGRNTEQKEMDISDGEDTNGTLGLLRQVYMYKKMYTRNHNTIIKAAEICQDPVVKEMLIKCQIDTEELFVTKGMMPPDLMSSEELIIAYLKEKLQNRLNIWKLFFLKNLLNGSKISVRSQKHVNL